MDAIEHPARHLRRHGPAAGAAAGAALTALEVAVLGGTWQPLVLGAAAPLPLAAARRRPQAAPSASLLLAALAAVIGRADPALARSGMPFIVMLVSCWLLGRAAAPAVALVALPAAAIIVGPPADGGWLGLGMAAAATAAGGTWGRHQSEAGRLTVDAARAAVRAEATLGEICGVRKQEWGEYREPARF